MESLIVMSVMLIIMVAAEKFVSSGVEFYRNSVQNLEVQQATLVALTKMADELEMSNLEKIFVPPAPGDDALVFPSPLTVDGQLTGSMEGITVWNSVVCFAPRVLANGQRVIERKAEFHDPVDYPPDPLTIAGGARDVAYFSAQPPRTIMAHHLAVPEAGDPPFQVVKGVDKITLTLKVEFSQRTKDTMKVTTEVFPRN